MGRHSLFDRYALRDAAIAGAIASFSMAHADQNEKDHDARERAVHSGKVKATFEEEK